MAALTDLSDLINRYTGGNSGSPEIMHFFKIPRIAGSGATNLNNGREHSIWRYDGMPAGGAIPTTAEIPNRTTAGAIPYTSAGGTRQKFLLSNFVSGNVSGTWLLYDRLFHIGGLSGTVTTAQTVQGSPASPVLTRYTDGKGNFVFYEIYTALGGSGTTITMNYTDQDGNTGIISPSINIGAGNFSTATRAQRIPFASGDTGVRAVESVTLSSTTGTAGNFGITIAHPIAYNSIGPAASAGWRDYTTGLPGIPDPGNDACLALLFRPNAGTAPECFGFLDFVEK